MPFKSRMIKPAIYLQLRDQITLKAPLNDATPSLSQAPAPLLYLARRFFAPQLFRGIKIVSRSLRWHKEEEENSRRLLNSSPSNSANNLTPRLIHFWSIKCSLSLAPSPCLKVCVGRSAIIKMKNSDLWCVRGEEKGKKPQRSLLALLFQ